MHVHHCNIFLYTISAFRLNLCICQCTEKQKDVSDLDSSQSSSGGGADSDTVDHGCGHIAPTRPAQHYGSFYLRMGAVAFGIGSMIYSGLEFGQYFELERNTKCHNIMLALTPTTRMAFIFIQMYFIFLNDKVKELLNETFDFFTNYHFNVYISLSLTANMCNCIIFLLCFYTWYKAQIWALLKEV